MNKKEQILNVFEAMISIKKSLWDLLYLHDEGIDVEDTEKVREILSKLIDYNHIAEGSLMDNIEAFTGVDDNDFIGDGYFMLCDEAFGGELTPEQALDKFNEVDVVGQRHWVINYNLDMLDEYNEKVNKKIDTERSRVIFDARIKVLLEQTGLPDLEKIRYTKMLLDYVKGKIDRGTVIKEYEFYIYK